MAGKALTIRRGETFRWTLRLEQSVQRYALITAMTQTAPIVITAEAHGLLDGWRTLITGAKGMPQLNPKNSPPLASDYHQVSVVDADTIEINAVNAVNFPAYTTGGVLQYPAPMDLTGVTVRGHIRSTVQSPDILLDLADYATIDAALCRIDIVIPDSITSALVGPGGVYDLEIEDAAGEVLALPQAAVTFVDEVTR